MPATTKGRKHAIEQLNHRRAHKPKQIDNASLYAGSPMYYYCVSCEHIAAVLPECHSSPAPTLCKECAALKECGWLE